MPELRSPLKVGDRFSGFSLPSTSGKDLSLEDLVGKPLVLFFYLKDGGEADTTELRDFRDLHSEFQKLKVNVVGVGLESVESHKQFAQANGLPFQLVSDAKLEVSAALGALQMEQVDGKPAVSLSRTTYITDVHFRVVKVYTDVSATGHAQQVLEDAKKSLFFDEPLKVQRHAPVLLIPDVLSQEECNQLIELWETGGNQDSGFMKQIDGKTVGLTDYSHKIRRDHFMQRGPLEEMVKTALANRVIPMIQQAFNYSVTRREDFRIACYDAGRGGYFRPHRDNTTAGTAHRRFAMSLLLNDDYENGWLRFPEYGPHLYRPPAGSAVVFSCSLLHEATDVTAGKRFVLLSFFYGEKEAKAREEYERRTGGAYRA